MVNNIVRISTIFLLMTIFTFASSAYATLQEGLVAWYPFDGDAIDATGNGHNGIVYGAVPTSDHFGNAGYALRFYGDDYISVPDHPEFTLGANDFTMAAWINLSAYGADGGYYLMAHSNGPGNTNKWIWWLANNGMSFITGPTGGWLGIGSYEFELQEWYHVAIRRNANELTAFVDGSPIGTVPFSLTIANPSASMTIGSAEFDRPNRYVNGSIDDVRLYARSLSDEEIRSLVPEPATIFILGLGGISLLRRVKRNTLNSPRGGTQNERKLSSKNKIRNLISHSCKEL